MIQITKGDLFLSGAEALVNTVNTRGVMGAGIALEFKKRYPRMFVEYQRVCRKGLLQPGSIHSVMITGERWLGRDRVQAQQWIVNFATKDDWKDPSKIEWIESGLIELRRWIRSVQPASIAIPALGCALGGLEFSQVAPLIEQNLGDLDLKVLVYPPRSTRPCGGTR